VSRSWDSSVPGRIYNGIGSAWNQGRLKTAWDRAVTHRLLSGAVLLGGRGVKERDAANWVNESCVGRTLHKFGNWLRKLGEGIRAKEHPILENSGLLTGGMRRLMLLAFALYFPIDKVLRDVLYIPVISSLWDEAFFLLAVGYLVIERITAKNPPPGKQTTIGFWIFVYAMTGVALIALLHTHLPSTISGYRATVQYILWFFVIYRLIRDAGDVKILYAGVLAVGLVTALYGFYQYAIGVEIPSYWLAEEESSIRTRIFSFFGSPNILGAFMTLTTLMSVGWFYAAQGWKKIPALVSAGISVAACLLTFSRGAWIGLAAACVVFTLVWDRRLLVALGAAIIGAMAVPNVRNRVLFTFTKTSLENNLTGGRLVRWSNALQYQQKYGTWWFGMGFGQYGGAVAVQNKLHRYLSYKYVDNYYLHLFVETGIVGLTAFAAMMTGAMTALRRVVLNLRRQDEKHRLDAAGSLCMGIYAGLSGMLVQCCVENLFEEPYMLAYFWGLTALVMAMGRMKKEKAIQ